MLTQQLNQAAITVAQWAVVFSDAVEAPEDAGSLAAMPAVGWADVVEVAYRAFVPSAAAAALEEDMGGSPKNRVRRCRLRRLVWRSSAVTPRLE